MIGKFFATAIFLILGITMLTSHLTYFTFAADSESSDGGGSDDNKDKGNDDGGDKQKEKSDSNDNGEDKQSKDDSNSDDSSDSPKEEKTSDESSGDSIIKSTPQTEEEKEKDKAESDVQQQDSADINDKPSDEPTQDEIDKEKAAIEDYIYDEPGKVKPYSTQGVKEPWKIKLIESLNSEAEQKIPQEQSKPALPDDPYEVCDVSDKCRGPGVKVNENGGGSITNCIGYYCFGDEEKEEYEKIIKSGKCDGINDSPKDKKDCLYNGGRGGSQFKPTGKGCEGINAHLCIDDAWCNKHKDSNLCKGRGGGGSDDDWKDRNDWCKWHKCKDDHHKHNHDNDKHYYNTDTNIYYYYYTNDYNNNHATVILQPDYSHTSNYHDIRLEIGFDFDTIINFAGKPENFVVTGLNINEGEQFNVCMKNENDGQTNCVTATLKDEDKAVYVDITVP